MFLGVCMPFSRCACLCSFVCLPICPSLSSLFLPAHVYACLSMHRALLHHHCMVSTHFNRRTRRHSLPAPSPPHVSGCCRGLALLLVSLQVRHHADCRPAHNFDDRAEFFEYFFENTKRFFFNTGMIRLPDSNPLNSTAIPLKGIVRKHKCVCVLMCTCACVCVCVSLWSTIILLDAHTHTHTLSLSLVLQDGRICDTHVCV